MHNWTKYIFKTVLDIEQRVVQHTSETLEKGNRLSPMMAPSDESFYTFG